MTILRRIRPSPSRALRLAFALTVGALAACGPSSRWFKGNLHTHSYWSDGDQFPEVILQRYREAGYDFVAMSDHNVLAAGERWLAIGADSTRLRSLNEYRQLFGEEWVEQRQDDSGQLEVRLKRFAEYADHVAEPGRFLVLQAEEITDHFESRPLHVNAINVRDLIVPRGGTSVADVLQRSIDAVLAQRKATGQAMFPHVNHPNYGWAVTAEDLMALEGERFFEVYNGHPLVHNAGDSLRPSTDRLWDIVLTYRLTNGLEVVYGIATDDAHNYLQVDATRANPARGWVMVRAPALSAEAIVAAMEAGEFYASTGVVLADIASSPERLALRIQGEPGVEYVTEFIGTREGFDRGVGDVPDLNGLPVTRRYSADIGAVLAEVPGLNPQYELSGDELYVRARVRASRPPRNPVHAAERETAWVQPVVLR